MTKQPCKQLEWRWRACQEESDKDMFKSAQRCYRQQIRETKRKALAECINHSSNSNKDIFAII